MVVGHSRLPHVLFGQDIELDTLCSLVEDLSCQGKVPLQYEGVILLLLCGGLTEAQGSGDVGHAVVELGTGIEYQKSVMIDFLGGFGSRTVMTHRTVFGKAGDGIE